MGEGQGGGGKKSFSSPSPSSPPTRGGDDLYGIQNVRRKFSDFAYKNLIILREGFKIIYHHHQV